MPEAKILGQLLLMQSVVINLPTEESIVAFVKKGLSDIPGVKSVVIVLDRNQESETKGLVVPLVVSGVKLGEIKFVVESQIKFNPYREYVLNFAFTLAVILEERKLRKKNRQYQTKLEELVADKTAMLEEEIEERKQIQANLKESETLFRKLLEQAPVAIYLIDKMGQLVIANKASGTMLGYSQEEMSTKTLFDLQAESSTFEQFEEKWRYAKQSKSSQVIDKHKTKDNSIIDVQIFSTSIVVNQEEYLLTYVEDVSKKLIAEKELKESIKKFETFFNAVSDMIFIHPYTPEGFKNIMDVNNVACKVLGYTREELLQLTVADITLNKALQHTNNPEFRKMMINTLNYSFETVMVSKSGLKIPVEISANIVTFNNQKIIIAAARDIRERKDAQRVEKELSERNQLVLDSSLNGFVLTDNKANIIDANPAYVDMIGYTKDELCVMNMKDIDPGLSMDMVEDSIAESTNNTLSYRFESKHMRKDGKLIHVNLSITVMKQNNKRLFVGFVRDITKEKIAEQNIRRQNEEYQRLNDLYLTKNERLTEVLGQMQAINKQLEISKEKAEESDKLKSVFLANMSHEIRTPMNGILGFANLLKTPELSPDKKNKYVEIIKKSGERMLSIINDLIDISKIEAGQTQLSKTSVSCTEVLQSQYNFFLPEAEQKALDFQLYIGVTEKESVVYTDSTKLTQVLTNLIKNALKFTSKGFIKLSVERIGSEILFSVSDSGKGVDADMKEKVFERFRQATLTPEIGEEGAGLGLSISKGFIELLGGKIWVESEAGKGSVFYFSLPIEEKEQEVIVVENKPAVTKPKGLLKILVTEDDEISYKFLEEILRMDKHDVIWAKNGAEAVEFLKGDISVDLILMDIKMPVLNGFDATKTIRSFNSAVPIIMQSAFVTEQDVAKAKTSGCNDFIKKPVSRTELQQKIKKYARI